jgi:homoserine kinase
MVEVRVPATSANMGPGFDCLGIALDMYNYIYVEEIEKGLEFIGFEECYKNENNLVYSSMKICFERTGYEPSGLRIEIKSDIPASRGLGSSAACIVGGVMAANELSGAALDKNELLKIATKIEGHPDNVAPALFGGMVISILDKKDIYYDKIKLSQGFKFCALIPDFQLSTKEARAVLPKSIDFSDGVFNTGRACLMIASLASGNKSLLRTACEDRLHQPYRGKLIPDFEKIIGGAYSCGALGAFLSGAGPSIMVILDEENKEFLSLMEEFLGNLEGKWILKEMIPDFKGALAKRII